MKFSRIGREYRLEPEYVSESMLLDALELVVSGKNLQYNVKITQFYVEVGLDSELDDRGITESEPEQE